MQASNNIPEELKTPNYRLTELDGLGRDLRLERQDPSNVIKAGDLFYVWYTQRPANINPYASTIYYSASRDGLKWEDRGQALGKGEKDAWDSFGVITPYMAVINGKYYLYYTATSAEEEKFDYCGTLRHIGVAVSESPDGPWMKYKGNPVLSPSAVAEDYDSLVVDDTHMIVRNEKCWLYFKGRGISRSSEETQWGVAFSDKPTGPFTKYEQNPVLESGHTVCVWPHREGVAALVDLTNTVQYASDGIHFQCAAKLAHVDIGCGPYDPDAFNSTKYGRGISWGVAQRKETAEDVWHLVRVDVDCKAP